MEAIATFLSRISNYNLLNNLIPGAILCVLLKYLVGYNFLRGGAIEISAIIYFTGMINGRIGSLLVEEGLKILKILPHRDHKLFVEAEQKDARLSLISETNTMYRSMISVVVTTIILKLYHILFEMDCGYGSTSEWVLLGVLFILFVCAYIKQTNYVVSRIDYQTKGKK